MDTSDVEKQRWSTLAAILERILQNRVGLTEGCREVCRLRSHLGLDNPLFMPFVGYESEADAFPLGEVRKLWALSGLEKADHEREKTEAHYREWIFEAARELLRYAKEQSSLTLPK